eukprot:CAMPEP_0115000738 /NCGR_PEP_ID=MMETSP0216-20121206/16941_1 /TAXON_ID=223996 /ORGANISM="Protocruzia adherens, Strain Boccale" /LENGTH=703 /DNA_ID=CAMNT_0002365903 /DNA_START=289 /DNA_END=2401 /DNA_ORIENTATION=-
MQDHYFSVSNGTKVEDTNTQTLGQPSSATKVRKSGRSNTSSGFHNIPFRGSFERLLASDNIVNFTSGVQLPTSRLYYDLRRSQKFTVGGGSVSHSGTRRGKRASSQNLEPSGSVAKASLHNAGMEPSEIEGMCEAMQKSSSESPIKFNPVSDAKKFFQSPIKFNPERAKIRENAPFRLSSHNILVKNNHKIPHDSENLDRLTQNKGSTLGILEKNERKTRSNSTKISRPDHASILPKPKVTRKVDYGNVFTDRSRSVAEVVQSEGPERSASPKKHMTKSRSRSDLVFNCVSQVQQFLTTLNDDEDDSSPSQKTRSISPKQRSKSESPTKTQTKHQKKRSNVEFKVWNDIGYEMVPLKYTTERLSTAKVTNLPHYTSRSTRKPESTSKRSKDTKSTTRIQRSRDASAENVVCSSMRTQTIVMPAVDPTFRMKWRKRSNRQSLGQSDSSMTSNSISPRQNVVVAGAECLNNDIILRKLGRGHKHSTCESYDSSEESSLPIMKPMKMRQYSLPHQLLTLKAKSKKQAEQALHNQVANDVDHSDQKGENFKNAQGNDLDCHNLTAVKQKGSLVLSDLLYLDDVKKAAVANVVRKKRKEQTQPRVSDRVVFGRAAFKDMADIFSQRLMDRLGGNDGGKVVVASTVHDMRSLQSEVKEVNRGNRMRNSGLKKLKKSRKSEPYYLELGQRGHGLREVNVNVILLISGCLR